MGSSAQPITNLSQFVAMQQLLRSNELPESPTRGPFGGVQSELPLDYIENFGFADCLNVMFRKGAAFARPRVNSLHLMPDPQEPWVGVADFFTTIGQRIQVAITPTRLFKWDGAAQDWVQITGTLTGLATQIFTSSVVGGKLFFCQGVDKVQVWDGVTAGFGDAAVAAVPAKFLNELNFHLLAANTIEGGTAAPQRIRWTGAGDGTDWTSFSSGQADLFNDLGPITGLAKIFQSGYAFQQWGITQIIPTGNGLAPFQFQPLGSKAKGNIAPYSLVTFGEDISCYIGKNNIYVFNGTSSEPIGDSPIEGTRGRVGARRRIFNDLRQEDLSRVYGYLSTSINGNDYQSYWIFMPITQIAWVYHFDEGNWTRFDFDHVMSVAGEFNREGVIRIIDLISTISAQTWTPATLTGNNPLDSMFLGFQDGTPGIIDFTGVCERQMYITSGQCYYRDYRHEHTVKKFRIINSDQGVTTFTLQVTNEKGQTQSQTFAMGTGSGLSLTRVIEFNIPGRSIVWKLTCEAGQPLALSEITPIYDIGGEVRGGE